MLDGEDISPDTSYHWPLAFKLHSTRYDVGEVLYGDQVNGPAVSTIHDDGATTMEIPLQFKRMDMLRCLVWPSEVVHEQSGVEEAKFENFMFLVKLGEMFADLGFAFIPRHMIEARPTR